MWTFLIGLLLRQDTPGVVVPVKPARKKYDSTKYTQYQYDFIRMAHREWALHNSANPTNKKVIQDLADIINERMLTNKSKSSLSTIWNNRVDRDSLAAGTHYFVY
jgi:hypothetical protein